MSATGKFVQFHLRDGAHRCFQTQPEATRNDLEHCLTALRNYFCNPQLQELQVIKLESIKFDPKTDSPENFLVNLIYGSLRIPRHKSEFYPPGADQAARNAVDRRNV